MAKEIDKLNNKCIQFKIDIQDRDEEIENLKKVIKAHAEDHKTKDERLLD
jgi:phage-related protein